ncbi:MAG: Gfo/Idh/MocA family oxidoreductase [Verrucomicrobiales bacterium]|nr:Gfo/Idh/MocA family oxidoreductase [Verrucomicrobiales bacterium]
MTTHDPHPHPPHSEASTAVLTRRGFLQTASAAGALGLVSAPFVASRSVLGANDRLGVGFIGVGGRGRGHLDIVLGMINQGANLQVIGISDTYGPRMRANAEHARAKTYPSYQALLDDPAIDVVCIASPDRLHVPQALAAIRAGKDVYCEKPMGHWSQFALSKQFYEETVQRKRVVQIGNQGNSNVAWKKVAELIRQGAIGRPQHVEAGYYRYGDWGERMPISDPNAKPGPDLDWDGFLGDAPKVPFTVDRFFSWRKYLDYAGGPCTDLFPHVLTPFISLLGLKFPSLAVASGGIFKYDTYDREVPDTFNMCLDYPSKLSIVLVCTLANEHPTEPAIRGDEGTITMQGPAFEGGFDSVTFLPRKGEKQVIPGSKPNTTLLHWQNFLECVRSRAKPVSDVEFGLYVQAAMNMAMLAFLNRKVATYDTQKQDIVLG